MAITQNTYTGNGSTVLYSFTFPYLDSADVKVSLNGTLTTAYTFANATTIQFATAPSAGVAIRIYRETDSSTTVATFYPGSSIKAADLNDNFTQDLYLAQEANNEADSATATANTALTNSNTAISTANSAVSTANNAVSTANSAVSTANAASSTAASAVSTANTASSNATTAINTANAASATAASAVSTANNAVSTANSATNTANSALSAANSAVSTANTANSNASAAVSTANTASTNANTAISTANSAVSTANSALTSANNAVSNSNTAVSTATSADIKATQAIAAVASSALYTVVANVAAIPVSPVNNTAIEVANSTGIESFTPLANIPAGFIGSPGLSVRIIYSTTGPTWNWIQYFPNDPENRYLKLSGGTLTGNLTLPGAPSSSNHATTKSYVDSADSTLTSSVATAQSTANAALPKAGGTMTGSIVFAAGQTFPAGSTSVAGVVQLTDSTSSTSTSTAATPNSVKSVFDVASAALPKSGGTLTGSLSTSGTNTADSFIPTSSTTPQNGVYLPSANTVGISTNGTLRHTFSSLGQVSYTPLTVGGTIEVNSAPGTDAAIFKVANTEYLRVDSTGLVKATGDVLLDNRSDLRFGEATANGTNYVGFQAPANILSNVLWTLPATDAAVSGYALKSDGAGNLSWGLAGGASGGGANQVFYENDQQITTSYTITAGKNAMTAGPVTITSSAIVTVPSGSSWTII